MKTSELIRLLQRDGWIVVSQAGSHKKYEHPTKKGQIIVPDHGAKEVGKGLAFKILKQAGLKK